MTPRPRSALEVTVPPPSDSPVASQRRPIYTTVIRAEKYWVDKARIDPAFFHHYVLGKEPAAHHKIWYANLFHPKIRRLNLIAPRESAKTTVLIMAMTWLIGKAPHLTNGIISVASDQAEARLRTIRSLITSNDRFRNVFPDVHLDNKAGEPNTQSQFSVYSDRGGISYAVWRSIRARNSDLKDPTLFSAGVGGSAVIGKRISGILLLDDIIDQNDLTPKSQDDTMVYLMQTLIPLVKEEGKACNIGTRWMINDVPDQLSQNAAWKTIKISSLRANPDTGELESYWPGYWRVQKLLDKKAEMNNDALFEVMYQNNPISSSQAKFTLPSLSHDVPHPYPAFTTLYVGTDLALSTDASGDYTVYSASAFDKGGNMYILDVMRFKGTLDVMIKNLGLFCDRVSRRFGRLDMVIIENVAFQSVFLQAVAPVRPDLPLDKHVPKGNKDHRVSALSNLAMQGKLYIDRTMAPENLKMLQTEAMNYGFFPHDDILDSITISLQYSGISFAPAKLSLIESIYLL